MVKSKKYFWSFGSVASLGIVFGLFIGNEDIPSMSPHEARIDAAVGFVVFLGFMLLALAGERILITVGRFLARTVSGQSSFHSIFSAWSNPFFHYVSWFFLFFGIGLAISTLWREPNRLWVGLVYFSGGFGLLIGCAISKWLSNKLNGSRNF